MKFGTTSGGLTSNAGLGHVQSLWRLILQPRCFIASRRTFTAVVQLNVGQTAEQRHSTCGGAYLDTTASLLQMPVLNDSNVHIGLEVDGEIQVVEFRAFGRQLELILICLSNHNTRL